MDKLDLTKNFDTREQPPSHKREFSLPDYLHVDLPDKRLLRESLKTAAAKRTAQTQQETDNSIDENLTAVLSKQNGWVTVDVEHLNRKMAAESF